MCHFACLSKAASLPVKAGSPKTEEQESTGSLDANLPAGSGTMRAESEMLIMKKAAVLMDNGFEELEAMGSIALLRRAGMDLDLVSAANTDEVTGRFGVTYSPAVPMKDYDFSDVDVLIIPGGPHYAKLEANEDVKKLIRQFNDDSEKYIAAICAAPTILGRMGLLEGRDYTCFTSMNDDFGGTYKDQKTVQDGNLITGRSADAAIDFAYAIMEALLGDKKTEEVKASIYAL